MGKIYLARHGETLWNNTMRFQGITDIELSQTGIEQAKQFAKSMEDKKIEAIYASDLRRAFQTADFVAKQKGMTVIQEPLLKEMSFGEWEGLNSDQIEKKFPGSVATFFENPEKFNPPGGESVFQMQERACSAFYRICEQNKGNNILIVSHGGVIRAILADILQMKLAGIWRMRQNNTGLNIIEKFSTRYVINAVNSTVHLD